ncbi:sterol desaturase family protein [Sinorhizobium fredii]|uniref:Fatty acid hydroxylase n=2 Tax=Rhizobium fredii TaxID=380 RepID=G9AI39_SINF1|nr:sterol desaturase family protein [Sinorhizobium fredii]MQW95689.1 sterol desaturase family protein [Sinorhizobium fredii]CCF00721.1 putative fatty acid hydroxylase [Sinorhizobium fredii HH103]
MLELIDLKAILIIAMIFIPLERLLPLHADQKVLRKHWLNDVIYLFFNGILIKLGFLALVGSLMIAISFVVPESLFGIVQAQPIWLQAIEVTLVADTGFYLAHRAFHSMPFLWKFHSIHHSIEEMDWLAGHRVHPVDQIATMTASLLPVYALGFSGAAIAIYALVYQGQSLLIHSNTRIRFGPFKWVLASPQFHHWHHANERQAYDKNFAGQLPFIDALAGTLYMPERMPTVYGTDDPVPAHYHQQLAYPLKQLAGRVPAGGLQQHPGDTRP